MSGAERDLHEAVERRFDRCRMGDGGRQHHDDGGERRHVEAGIDRGQQHQRRNRERQNAQQRELAAVRNEGRHGARIDGAAERADEIVDRRLHGSADARLGDDDGGQDRPQHQGHVQPLPDHQGQHGGDRHPDAEPQLRLVLPQIGAQPGPGGCDRAHAELPCDDAENAGSRFDQQVGRRVKSPVAATLTIMRDTSIGLPMMTIAPQSLFRRRAQAPARA